MKTSEKIKYATDRGYHVVVKHVSNEEFIYSRYAVISKFYGTYKRSIWSGPLEKAKESMTNFGGVSLEDFNDGHYTIHEIFMLPYKSYEVGEKVMHEGKVFVIIEVLKTGNYDISRCDVTENKFSVNHKDLLPYFEEQDDKTKEAIEYLQKGGYKIIKE